jgi:hypothetical protein
MRRLIKMVLALTAALCLMLGSLPMAAAATIPLTDIQKQPASYVNIQDVGAYREDIIPQSLIDGCTLPEAGGGKVPYWTGYILENKIYANAGDSRWTSYTGGSKYFVEGEIAYLHNSGFNCARAVYSLSFLSKPGSIDSINMAELWQLDELIAWGLKYNVHIMLSITGMPGKANLSVEEESVQGNNQIFTDPEMAKAYGAYMEMLAKRYAGIPAKALSFELLAEPAGNYDAKDPMKNYVDTLKPVAKAMWKYNPDRILIANDLGKGLPSGLAAIGCCLSLHSHIYLVDGQRLHDLTGLCDTARWPMEFLPEWWERNTKLTLKSEAGFVSGELTLHYSNYNQKPKILADGITVFTPDSKDKFISDPGSFSITIPEGTKKLEVRFTDGFSLIALKLRQQGKETILPVHSIYDSVPQVKQVTILVHPDGATENADKPRQALNSDYFYKAFMKPFEACAKKYGVSFLMTEVGTDTQSLTPEEYVAYHETWLDALGSHQIPWMYNCIHNILAPMEIMWQNESAGFTQFRQAQGLPYMENALITDMLRKYQGS